MASRLLILLAFTLLLMEAYSFFPKGVYLHLFYFNKGKTESIRWFVTAIADRTIWVVTCLFFCRFITTYRPELSKIAFIFVLYRSLDLLAYILNGSISGKFYLIVYIPISIYVLFLSFNKQIWQAAEWIYSKTRINGNNR